MGTTHFDGNTQNLLSTHKNNNVFMETKKNLLNLFDHMMATSHKNCNISCTRETYKVSLEGRI